MDGLVVGDVKTLAEASRFTIQLSTGKSLVLFKLTHLPRANSDDKSLNCDGQFDYFCMNQECPHAGGPMEDSTVEYDVEDDAWIASCPWHSYDFNIETGESPFGIKACTYPVTIRNNILSISHPRDCPTVRIDGIHAVSEAFGASSSGETQDSSTSRTVLSNGRTLNVSEAASDEDLTLSASCKLILMTPEPEQKILLTHALYQRFCAAHTTTAAQSIPVGTEIPPDVPPRTSLKVIHPSKMGKMGRAGNIKSRIAILHSLANIEQWAIDLAIDICIRFADFRTHNNVPLPRQFFLDWIKVANDEAKHFSLLRTRLEELGSYFGELPVHHGLWDSATITAHDLRARISIIALVHEARGLDVNPQTIAKFKTAGDQESVRVLEIIHKDEITHVTTGHRWLSWICEDEGSDTIEVFRENVKKYFMGAIKGPFNVEDRKQAGLEAQFYEKLPGRPKVVLTAGG